MLGKSMNKKINKMCHCIFHQIYLRQEQKTGPIPKMGDTVLDLCPDLMLGYFLSTQDINNLCPSHNLEFCHL